MSRLIECVPNFSEGRDPAKIDAIVSAMSWCYPLLTALNLLCLAIFALRLKRWQAPRSS